MPARKLRVHPAEFWTAAETIEKINKRKLCLADTRGDCNGQIVEAHTIPRSQLQKIALNGHVYHIAATPSDLLKNDGRFTIGKRGITKFSVLNFFCAEHDQEIFSHVESDELVFDPHQLALLHYRAMGAELYKKINALDVVRYQIRRMKDRRDDGERIKEVEAFETGTMLGLRDMARTFPKCEALLVDEEHERTSALVIRFKKMPSIMTVGGFSPEFDYNGRLLQRLGKAGVDYEQIGFSILAAQDRTAVAFTWLHDANVCKIFAQSFVTQSADLFATLAIQTAFEHLENTCMNIPWWDSLRQIERDKLLERMQLAGSSFDERTSGCLGYCGITFDQWEYDRHVFVNCD